MNQNSPSPSLQQLVLVAQQRNIEAIEHLAVQIDLVDVAGQLIYLLQRERGASSIFLGSQGQLFRTKRLDIIREVEPVAARLQQEFARQLAPELGSSARMLSLMAWVQLDLDTLPALRSRIEGQTLDAHESVATFSRLIASLMELIFQVADATLHPGMSSLLVAYLHLLQSIEAAGQERAVGALLFASARSQDADQQRVIHLIEAQEHNLKVFEEFADEALNARWHLHLQSPAAAQLERLRRTLCTARPNATLDAALSDQWFEVCSERIGELWQMQKQLIGDMRRACSAQISAARQALSDTEGLLQTLRANPPVHAHAVESFFEAQSQPLAVPVLTSQAERPSPVEPDQAIVSALQDMLTEQAGKLARMEAELSAAKRALNDRKVIDRAKGVLMRRLGLPEDVAFRMLQKTAMDQNRRLVDVAEALMAVPDLALAERQAADATAKGKR